MAILDQLQALPQQWERLLEDRFRPLIDQAKMVASRTKNPTQSSYMHGLQLFEQGNYEEAKIRFKFVLWRNPTHARALYYMAECHFAMGEKYAGLEALNKSLIFNERDEMALFRKASIDGGQFADHYEPHTTPTPMVKEEFNPRAMDYAYQEFSRGYRGHEILATHLLHMPHYDRAICDIGCGTGICGPLMRPYASRMTGIDISPAMLEVAKRYPIQTYDEFIEIDLRDHLLNTQGNPYDIISALNVLPIVGGLAPVMDGVKNALRHEGQFIFTAYELQATEGYKFIPDVKRFAHSKHYITEQAERVGLKVLRMEEVRLYEVTARTTLFVILQK